ncbi:hypothetical protein BB560_001251 [Smittium megazygosporum]|uniref:Trm112p-like protein n=1 Tax=Smittium megazygosporum TaxID=133381 RepID=A0A2T9ZI40_9FUNG|nr:hypothetical protein BB560_001251 [Smittium megazygosporum]
MRLLTHNMLKCHVKNCPDQSKNFPLRIQEAQIEQIETELNPEFINRMLPRLEWDALVSTAKSIDIKEGKMICESCGHIYPIKNSVPNMLLAEHEI